MFQRGADPVDASAPPQDQRTLWRQIYKRTGLEMRMVS